jgi:hypothetical protein
MPRAAAAVPGSRGLTAGALALRHDPDRRTRPFPPRHDSALPFDPAALPADSDEGGHRFQFDRGHHSNLMAAMLASSRGPVLVMS